LGNGCFNILVQTRCWVEIFYHNLHVYFYPYVESHDLLEMGNGWLFFVATVIIIWVLNDSGKRCNLHACMSPGCHVIQVVVKSFINLIKIVSYIICCAHGNLLRFKIWKLFCNSSDLNRRSYNTFWNNSISGNSLSALTMYGSLRQSASIKTLSLILVTNYFKQNLCYCLSCVCSDSGLLNINNNFYCYKNEVSVYWYAKNW